MAYIAPNSEIGLLKNIPLDASYDHTITFANSTQQYLYFRGKVADGNGRIFPQNSYQRTSSNKIRLELGMDEAIQYNYLFFRNISFENKYFYAFITNWEYVNNITTEITYEIDVMQTFITNAVIKQCFVEREHIQNDTIGANLVPENLEIGDYIVDGMSVFQPYNIAGVVNANGCAIFYCTFSQDKDETTGQVTGYSKFNGGILHNVYTALCPIPINSEEGIRNFINDVSSSTFPFVDGIVAAYMCPFEPLVYGDMSWDFVVPKHTTSLAGYVPKNKKLFTAPYNMLRILTDTDSETYRYEYFSNYARCEFRMAGYFLPEPVLSLIPKNYQTIGNRVCTENRMTIKEFPQVAIDVDVWKVYIAQHGASLVTSMIGQAMDAGSNVVKAAQRGIIGDASAVLDTASSFIPIAQSVAQIYETTKRPPELKGTQTSLSDYSLAAKLFYAQFICIRPEFARIIDDYFTMFGYATHRVKVPNIRGRRYFNYVQTKACILEGAIPEIYKQKMINIFNHGITFWHTENLASVADVDNIIGDYSVANDPV